MKIWKFLLSQNHLKMTKESKEGRRKQKTLVCAWVNPGAITFTRGWGKDGKSN